MLGIRLCVRVRQSLFVLILFFFFFQAEDGIRDHCVTGVQTCALLLLILKSEDLYQDPAAVLKRVLEFLGVPAQNLNKEYKNYRRPSKKGYRKKVSPPKMDPEIRSYLLEYFGPHNARLYGYLGIDFGWDH